MISVYFTGQPNNYARINEKVSRSVQPAKEDFKWLKDNGVTDVINFRTMGVAGIDFDEELEVKKLGMNYHNIPTHTKNPKSSQVFDFLNLVDKITNNDGKVHIHCKTGADRTGMYSFIYKSVKNIGSLGENVMEWINRGYHLDLYPKLLPWAYNFVAKLKH